MTCIFQVESIFVFPSAIVFARQRKPTDLRRTSQRICRKDDLGNQVYNRYLCYFENHFTYGKRMN